jgi:hypothetical protein
MLCYTAASPPLRLALAHCCVTGLHQPSTAPPLACNQALTPPPPPHPPCPAVLHRTHQPGRPQRQRLLVHHVGQRARLCGPAPPDVQGLRQPGGHHAAASRGVLCLVSAAGLLGYQAGTALLCTAASCSGFLAPLQCASPMRLGACPVATLACSLAAA